MALEGKLVSYLVTTLSSWDTWKDVLGKNDLTDLDPSRVLFLVFSVHTQHLVLTQGCPSVHVALCPPGQEVDDNLGSQFKQTMTCLSWTLE